MTIFTVIIILIFLFFLSLFLINISLKDLFKNISGSVQDSLLLQDVKISIVVSAKNETANIESLVNSLSKLDYPKDNFEVIIIDDHSNDNTLEIVKGLIKEHDNISIHPNENEPSLAKKGALTFGIAKAKFSFIMITDADCRPEPGWLKSFSKKFTQGFDFVFGIAPFYSDKSFIGNYSGFENLRSSILTFSLANLGYPYSAAARSFGFSKKAFKKIEGYKNTLETLSGDDDLLLREAIINKMKIEFVTDKEAFVFSSSKKTLEDYSSQKARHTKTSFHYLLHQKIILGFWHLLNLALFFSPILVFVNIFFVVPFVIKIICDEIIVLSFQKKFGYNFKIGKIILMQIVYEAFIIINFFNALFRKDKWK